MPAELSNGATVRAILLGCEWNLPADAAVANLFTAHRARAGLNLRIVPVFGLTTLDVSADPTHKVIDCRTIEFEIPQGGALH